MFGCFMRHIGLKRIENIEIQQVGKIKAVDDAELQLLQIHRLNGDGLIHFPHLGQLRVRFSVGTN